MQHKCGLPSSPEDSEDGGLDIVKIDASKIFGAYLAGWGVIPDK